MEVNDGNTINMSGKIITEGSGSGSAFDRGYTYSDDGGFIIWDSSMINRGYGIKGDDHNTITVDGTIETFGDFAGGLYAYRNNIIDISGEINTYGRESEAVIINSDNQIIADRPAPYTRRRVRRHSCRLGQQLHYTVRCRYHRRRKSRRYFR